MELNEIFAALLGNFYGLNEIRISIGRYYSSSKATSKDGGTFRSLWIVIMSSILTSVHLVRRGYGWKMIDNPSCRYFLLIPTGVSLFLLGHILRQQAIKQLGQWFTTAVRTDENQQLIDVGWYARMRHPSYTGALVCFFGPSLLMNNWLSLIGIMVPICSVFLYRIEFNMVK